MLTPEYEKTILTFWQKQFIDPPEALQLVATTISTQRSYHSDEQHVFLSKELTQQVKTFAQTEKVSFNVKIL